MFTRPTVFFSATPSPVPLRQSVVGGLGGADTSGIVAQVRQFGGRGIGQATSALLIRRLETPAWTGDRILLSPLRLVGL